MIFVGMDVSSKEFMVHAIRGNKKVVANTMAIRPDRSGMDVFLNSLGREKKYLVMEAGNQLKWIGLHLKTRKDVELHVVHPNEIKWINQSSKKTDKVDAKKMAALARIDGLPGKVYIPEGAVRKLMELISARECLMKKRVDLINSLRGMMKQEGFGFPEKFFQSKNWQTILKTLPLGETQKIIVENMMFAIEQMKVAEDSLMDEICKVEDPRIELLESIPSLGRLSARVLLSAIGEVDRFENKKDLAKYGALAPKIYQSGDVSRTGKTDNAGRKEVRRVLVQCAHTIGRMSKNKDAVPLYNFGQKILKKRNKKVATIALARKLLCVAYGVLKNGEFYDPSCLMPKAA